MNNLTPYISVQVEKTANAISLGHMKPLIELSIRLKTGIITNLDSTKVVVCYESGMFSDIDIDKRAELAVNKYRNRKNSQLIYI